MQFTFELHRLPLTMKNGSHLILFSTVAYKLPGAEAWTVDVHGWCYDTDEDRHFQRTTANILRRSLKLGRGEPDPPVFRERAFGFVVENRKNVAIDVFCDHAAPVSLLTKRNGHFRGSVTLPLSSDSSEIQTTSHGTLKISIQARRRDTGQVAFGTVHLPVPRGLSVISDIDDTIKFSNVGNKRELLANTFLRAFRCIEGMPLVYQRLAKSDVNFHYISATPWQLYQAVEQFLMEHQFPEGSVHLRKFALKDATILKKVFPAHKKKRKAIELLLTRFPERQFLLIGDTGEKDPEMYGEIARKYPRQILGICVRNVSPDPPDSLRFRRAFAQIPLQKWTVYEDALRLEENFLPLLLQTLAAPEFPQLPPQREAGEHQPL